MKIAILNQKGGVGKSAVTVNMGYGLAESGKKTLVIDLDPQAHSTMIYTPEIPKQKTVNDIFRDKNADIFNIIQQASVTGNARKKPLSDVKNLFIIPSNIHLSITSEMIASGTHREKILYNHLNKISDNYDYILVDCPSSLGVLTANAIRIADLILVPVSYSKYDLDGISDLFTVISEVKDTYCYSYRILRNIRDAREKRMNEEIEEQLEPFSENLLNTVIRKSEAVRQSQMLNRPVQIFEPKSQGVKDFRVLTEEILSYS